MAFSLRETRMVKGMLARGDKQHDIEAFFGVNGGRVAEVATDKGDYPTAQPLAEADLPPMGPYPSPYATLIAKNLLQDATKEIASAKDADVKETAIRLIYKAIDVLGK